MRRLALTALLVATSIAASGMPPVQSVARAPGTAPTCKDPSMIHQTKPNRGAKVSKLTDLPPANHYLSVYRLIDGCQVPVIAGYGIGATNPGR